MSEQEFQVVRVLGFGIALSLAVTLQALSPHARLRGSLRVNATFWILDVIVVGLVCGACACTAARWATANQIGIFHHLVAPPWLIALITIFTLDLVSYLWHRANHVIPLLWRFHQVHHSDSAFTVSTALRFHPGELLLSLPLRLAAVVALGAAPATVVTFEILFTIANLLEHGDIDLPRRIEPAVGRVCITPSLHRLHHSRDWARLNTNFGTIFAVWDRLFATYHHSSSDLQIETGLPDRPGDPSWRQAVLLPLRSAGTVRRFG